MNAYNLPGLWRQAPLTPSILPMFKAFQWLHLGQESHHDATSLRSPIPPSPIASKPIMRVRDQRKPVENIGLFCALYQEICRPLSICIYRHLRSTWEQILGVFEQGGKKYKAWLGRIYWHACIHPTFGFNELAQAPGSCVNSLLVNCQ